MLNYPKSACVKKGYTYIYSLLIDVIIWQQFLLEIPQTLLEYLVDIYVNKYSYLTLTVLTYLLLPVTLPVPPQPGPLCSSSQHKAGPVSSESLSDESFLVCRDGSLLSPPVNPDSFTNRPRGLVNT